MPWSVKRLVIDIIKMGSKRHNHSRRYLSNCQYHRFGQTLAERNRFKCARKAEATYKSVPVCNTHLYELRSQEADKAGWYKVNVVE